MRIDMNRLLASGHRYVIYDGCDLGQEFELLSVAVPVYPEIEPVTTDVPQKAGSHLYGRKLAPRDVTMRLAVRADSRDPLAIAQAWRSKSPLIYKDEARPLYLDDEMFLNAMAVGSSEMEVARDRGIVTVTFRAFDPYFYGPEHTVDLDGTARFRVVSQAPVWPVVTVTGASGDLQVRNRTTGDQVVVPGVAPTATIRIDMEDARVYANGNFKAPDMQLTDFFELRPGVDYEITVNSGTGTLTYRERAL